MYDFEICKLPLGLSGFSNIRKSNMIYVDKTELIAQIANQRTPLFLSRPRRFGKSLLINTLSCLFSNGVEQFNGLFIEKIWNDKKYTVVDIDFSIIASRDPASFTMGLCRRLAKQFKYNTTSYENPADLLADILQEREDCSTVLLIDEYDAPLTHHLSKPDELEEIISILNDFYATIKHYTDKFRLIFITGVTRASHVSIFSAFNNLLDVSLEEDFNNLLGFTQNDLQKYFDQYIYNAAHFLKMSKNDVYKRLEQYYDGFQFSLNANETVYNPWSILNFLKLPKNGFKNYWFKSSGSTSIIMQYVKNSASFTVPDSNTEILIREDNLFDHHEITNIPTDILLFQTGYLTIRKKTDTIAKLVFPNTEVEDSILKLYLLANNLKPDIKFSEEIEKLPSYIDKRDIKSIINIFNNILNDCVSILSTIFKNERSVRDIIYAALPQKITLQKIKERETAKGFSDLELLTQKTHMVIEFKRISENRDAQTSLQEAIEQIKNKGYGIGAFQNLKLYRVAMVISPEKKAILHDFCREVL